MHGDELDVDRFVKRRSTLRNDFTQHEDTFAEVMRYFSPRKGHWLKYRTEQVHDGSRRDHAIIDPTTTRTARNAAAGLQAGITSPSRPWKRLGPDDPDMMDEHGAREFYSELDKRLDHVLHRTNFYQASQQAYGDYVKVGPGCVQVDEHKKKVFHCTVHPVGSWVAARNADGHIDVFYRDYSFTGHQLTQKFGDKIPRQLADQIKLDPYKRHEVYNAIEPNPYYEEGKQTIGLASFPYLSVWWVKGSSEFLKTHGYHEFPVFVFSMYQSEFSDVYGYGAGVESLGDAKQLQHMQRMKLKAIDKTVDPPMQAPSSMRAQGVSQVPGEMNYHDSQQKIESIYNMNLPLQYVLQDIQECQTRLKEAFFEDLFLMITQGVNRQTTAREVEERHQEKLVMLGPVLEALIHDWLDPVLDRILSIMRRAGMWPEAPQSLQGHDFSVEYVSILAIAQRAIQTIAIEQGLNFVAQARQYGFEEMADRLDQDGVFDEYMAQINFPPTGIVPKDVAANARRARAQREQMATNIAMAREGAAAVSDASKADMTQPNVLTQMLGQVAA